MRQLLIAALLFAQVAQAAPVSGAFAHATRVMLTQTGDVAADEGEEDEEEDEEDAEEEDTGTTDPATPPGPGPGPDPTAAPAPAGDAPAVTPPSLGDTQAVPPPSAPVNPRAQELVSGAPLYNPNVAVHIVEKKQISDKGKHEIVLFPAAAQLNGKFTQHYGTALSYVYHLHENFGLQITPQFNWYNSESAFNQELIDKVAQEAQPATSLLLNWGVVAGVEVAPLYGKFAWYEDSLAHYSLIITGGAGYGSTRHQLKPANSAGPATYGDTGNRFIGSVGGGFRVLLGNRFAVRLEVRDIVYTARVDQVNGCNFDDLTAMRDRGNRDITSIDVSAGCKAESFDPRNEGVSESDLPVAHSFVVNPTSDVLNLVSFYGGVSFLF